MVSKLNDRTVRRDCAESRASEQYTTSPHAVRPRARRTRVQWPAVCRSRAVTDDQSRRPISPSQVRRARRRNPHPQRAGHFDGPSRHGAHPRRRRRGGRGATSRPGPCASHTRSIAHPRHLRDRCRAGDRQRDTQRSDIVPGLARRASICSEPGRETARDARSGGCAGPGRTCRGSVSAGNGELRCRQDRVVSFGAGQGRAGTR